MDPFAAKKHLFRVSPERPLPTPSLDRFALLAMKECGRRGSPAPLPTPEVEPRWRVLGWL